MRAHQENAYALAQHLEGHSHIERVFNPLLPSHPDHEVAARLLRNGIGTAALSKFVNEVRETPEEANMEYGVNMIWESGTRSHIEAKPMIVGGHKVSRKFSWKADEPRQLLGTNRAANSQELLLSGLGACMMVSFLAGASAKGD